MTVDDPKPAAVSQEEARREHSEVLAKMKAALPEGWACIIFVQKEGFVSAAMNVPKEAAAEVLRAWLGDQLPMNETIP